MNHHQFGAPQQTFYQHQLRIGQQQWPQFRPLPGQPMFLFNQPPPQQQYSGGQPEMPQSIQARPNSAQTPPMQYQMSQQSQPQQHSHQQTYTLHSLSQQQQQQQQQQPHMQPQPPHMQQPHMQPQHPHSQYPASIATAYTNPPVSLPPVPQVPAAAPQVQPQPQPQPPPPNTQQSYSKRKNMGIAIINPETGKSIFEEKEKEDVVNGEEEKSSVKDAQDTEQVTKEATSAEFATNVGRAAADIKDEPTKLDEKAMTKTNKQEEVEKSSIRGEEKQIHSEGSNKVEKTENTILQNETENQDSSAKATHNHVEKRKDEAVVAASSSPSSTALEGKAGGVRKKSAAERKAELNRKGDKRVATSELEAFMDSSETTNEGSKRAEAELNVENTTKDSIKKEKVDKTKISNEAAPSKAEETEKVDAVSKDEVEGDQYKKTASPKAEEVQIKEPKETVEMPEVSHPYAKDQWSPQNPDGKKEYGRDFLLSFMNIAQTQKKPDFPKDVLDIVKGDSATASDRARVVNSANRSIGANFMPNFVKPTLSKSGQGGKRGSNSGRREIQTKRIISGVSIGGQVELHSAENAWKPSVKSSSNTDEVDSNNSVLEDLAKKCRAILNKLTPQNFDKLKHDFYELPMDSQEKMQKCIELVFEKAVDEPGFSETYARLCEHMKLKPCGSTEDVKFRKLLITQVQREFERDYMDGTEKKKYEELMNQAPDEEKRKALMNEYEEIERKARRRSLGNIRFIGELYKLGMLTCPIIHGCVMNLLSEKNEEGTQESLEESLECLCRLLTTVGSKLEKETNEFLAKVEKTDSRRSRVVPLQSYFDRMRTYVDAKKVSSRVRFKLQDCIELRRNEWKPRRDIGGPKTIAQIHEDAKREKLSAEVEMQSNKKNYADMGRQSYSGGSSAHGSISRRKSQNAPQDVGRNASMSVNTQKLSGYLTKNDVGRKDPTMITLGPSSAPWTQGSRPGGRKGGLTASATTSNLTEAAATKRSNRFSALSTDEPSETPTTIPPSRTQPSQDNRMPTKTDEMQRVLQGVREVRSRPQHQANDQPTKKEEARAAAPKTLTSIATAPGDLSAITEQEGSAKQHSLLHGDPNLSNEQLEQCTHSLLNEYTHLGLYEVASEDLCKRFHPSRLPQFVEFGVNHLLDRPKSSHRLLGQLYAKLIKDELLLPSQLSQGLMIILEAASDIIIDVPHFWEAMGNIFGPLLEEDVFSFDFVLETSKALENKANVPVFFAHVLKAMVPHVGKAKAANSWRLANLQWSSFVPKNESTEDFISANGLEFTVGDISNGRDSSLARKMSKSDIENELRKMFEAEKKNEDIFNWIDTNIENPSRNTDFISALAITMTESAIVKSSKGSAELELDETKLMFRLDILKRFIDSQSDMELEVLLAILSLMESLDHPRGVLNVICRTLSDKDVISDEGFNAWRNQPGKTKGHGVAMTGLKQFFDWLDNPPDDEDDDQSTDIIESSN